MKPNIPPIVVLLIHFGLAWLIDRYFEFAAFSIPGQKIITFLLAISGFIISLFTMYTMYRAHTTIDPVFPEKASRLITHGIFRISRNPIYVALLLLLLAWLMWLGNMMGFALVVTFIWQMTRFQIMAEEQALEEKFGDEYKEYKNKVRRWI